MVISKATCGKRDIKPGAIVRLIGFGNHLESVPVGDINEGLGFLRVMSSKNDPQEEKRV
jgi:hypothetical protein